MTQINLTKSEIALILGSLGLGLCMVNAREIKELGGNDLSVIIDSDVSQSSVITMASHFIDDDAPKDSPSISAVVADRMTRTLHQLVAKLSKAYGDEGTPGNPAGGV